MSKRHFLREIFNMSYEDLNDLYQRLGTMKLVADKLDVTERTVRNWFKEGGLKGMRHTTYNLTKDNSFRRWVKEHPGERLPHSIAEIAKLTGLSKSLVYHHFDRKRQRIDTALHALPSLTSVSATLRDVSGSYVPTRNISFYGLKVDMFSPRVLVYGERVTGGMFKVLMSLKQYKEVVTGAGGQPKQRPDGRERPSG